MSRVLLSIGSNLGDRLARLQSVVDGLGDGLRAVSPVYETEPVGGPDQPDFLNAVVLAVTGDYVTWPTAAFWPWLLLGALSQIIATGLMLVAMNDRSFVVTTAYLKTEAIQTAIFGFVFLGDHLTWLKVIAILIATVGVVITALRPGAEKGFAEVRPTIIGLVSAAAFALSAIGYRGAIITVPGVSFVTAASYTLVWGLFAQTVVLTKMIQMIKKKKISREGRLCRQQQVES